MSNAAYDTTVLYPTIEDCKKALRFGYAIKGIRDRVCDALDAAEQEIKRLRDELPNPTPPVVEEDYTLIPPKRTFEMKVQMKTPTKGQPESYEIDQPLQVVENAAELTTRSMALTHKSSGIICNVPVDSKI